MIAIYARPSAPRADLGATTHAKASGDMQKKAFTGQFVAAGVLLASGMGVDKALVVVGTARGETIPETAVQLQWIEHLQSERLVLTS